MLYEVITLFDADSVLPGNRATDGDTQFQNLAGQVLGPFELSRMVGIVQDQWVQITVTGVKHVVV